MFFCISIHFAEVCGQARQELSILCPGTQVDILQVAGKLNRGRWTRNGVVISQGSNVDEYLVEDRRYWGQGHQKSKILMAYVRYTRKGITLRRTFYRF